MESGLFAPDGGASYHLHLQEPATAGEPICRADRWVLLQVELELTRVLDGLRRQFVRRAARAAPKASENRVDSHQRGVDARCCPGLLRRHCHSHTCHPLSISSRSGWGTTTVILLATNEYNPIFIANKIPPASAVFSWTGDDHVGGSESARNGVVVLESLLDLALLIRAERAQVEPVVVGCRAPLTQHHECYCGFVNAVLLQATQ